MLTPGRSHIWKASKLAFFAFKKLKNGTKWPENDIFREIFFYWSVRHEITFNLICHMLHIWKSTKLAFFALKKTQKWQKMAKNDFLEKCEKNIIFKWPYCSKMPKTSKIRSKLHFLVRKNGNLALFWGFSLKKISKNDFFGK